MEVRRAEFAGSWYPGRKGDCLEVMEEFERSAFPCSKEKGMAVGGIVPHAGWYYSGRLAFSVFRCLAGTEADTCLIFGRHLHSRSKSYIMKEGAWATPLGELPVDSELAERLSESFSFTVEGPGRFEADNTIELQLPFIKYFFPDIHILPLGLPPTPSSIDAARAAVKEGLSLGRRMVVIGSTDLTHYGPNYGFTPFGTGEKALKWVKEVNDKRVRDMILAMDGHSLMEESVRSANACCGGAVGAAVEAAKGLGAVSAREIGYYTSFDVRPDSSFVGYCGILFYAAQQGR